MRLWLAILFLVIGCGETQPSSVRRAVSIERRRLPDGTPVDELRRMDKITLVQESVWRTANGDEDVLLATVCGFASAAPAPAASALRRERRR